MAEILYAFYLIAGLVDGWLRANGLFIGIDISTTISIILFFIMLGNIITYKKFYLSKHFIDIFFILIGILLFAIISLLYTISYNYSYVKILYFARSIFVTFAFPFFIKDFNIERFIKYFIFFVFIYTIIYLYDVNIRLPYSNDPFYKSFVSQYLGIGIFNGIIFLLMIFYKKLIFKNETRQFIIALVALVFLAASAARGPAIFLLLVLLFSLGKTMYIKLTKKWIIIILLFLLLFLPAIAYLFIHNPKLAGMVSHFFERSINRFSKFLAFLSDPNKDESSEDRIRFFVFSVNHIFDGLKHILLGNGIGSFGLLYWGKDMRAYPHNIFIEAWVEIGIIPFLLFIFLFIKLFIIPRQNPYISSYVILFILLNLLKSYSFADMRVAYMFIALYLLPYYDKNLKNRLKE